MQWLILQLTRDAEMRVDPRCRVKMGRVILRPVSRWPCSSIVCENVSDPEIDMERRPFKRQPTKCETSSSKINLEGRMDLVRPQGKAARMLSRQYPNPPTPLNRCQASSSHSVHELPVVGHDLQSTSGLQVIRPSATLKKKP